MVGSKDDFTEPGKIEFCFWGVDFDLEGFEFWFCFWASWSIG
ncbi:uncharacterized protein METZ01_LOCUS243258 [marine metagenome]|uniref:Uncharacterized protein n=1 Tax=marine metagenome TaxID=408172 RepID=A0A382HSQ6_9ZZZZ